MLTKLGAIEILQSLLKSKFCYQIITSKAAFKSMTDALVSKDEDTMRFVYILMKDLVDSYITHERLEKRINIDNFEDDELMLNSGSFADKKSKNSKRQNLEVIKDV